MTDLSDLIRALEEAVEGSRELDKKIATVLGISWSPDEDGQFGGYGILPRRCHFTTSIDAALQLVEGWVWSVAQFEENAIADLTRTHGGKWKKVEGQRAVASTPALALCIASLKARHDQT